MPRLIVSLDAVVVGEETLNKARTTLGRRPYNDIVIDDLSVSGEHIAFHQRPDGVTVEDLGSTNGTLVNGQPVVRQRLQDHDRLEIGRCTIRYRSDVPAPAALRVVSGPAAGRDVALVKPVTTLGKSGALVASVTRQTQGCMLASLAGAPAPRVNGAPIGKQPVALRDGDLIEVAGIRLQFVQP